MVLVPGADVDEIRLFGVEHLAVVGVAMLLGDLEEFAEFVLRVRVGVGQGGLDLSSSPV